MKLKFINTFVEIIVSNMRKYIIISCFILPFLFSCFSTRKATYFTYLQDSIFQETAPPEHIIQKNDLLSITVNSLDPEASKLFNMPSNSQVRSSTPTGDVMEPTSYLVDREGFIRFLMLGNMRAEGLTKEQ